MSGSEPTVAEGSPRRLVHPSLEPLGEATPLDEARLTDQRRLAVVLQGAALLAHLEHGGWILPAGWDGAGVTAEGVLRVGAVRPGRSVELPQAPLLRLLRRLFRVTGELKGRGVARGVARELIDRWRQQLAPVAPDREVAILLEAAPFLWRPAFAAARSALAGEHRVGGERRMWVVGPGAGRRRFLAAAAADPRRLEELLRGPRARDLWEGYRPDADPRRLLAEGRLLRAAAVWRRRPPEDPEEALEHARCLFALGRYSQALGAVRRHRRFEARILRARCQLFLGELNAAQRTVRRLVESEPPAERLVELAAVAVRLSAARGRDEEHRGWVDRTLAVAETRGVADGVRLEAYLTVAEAAWDQGELEAMDRHLEAARPALDDPRLAGRWRHVRGLRSIGATDGPGAIEQIGAALGGDRRRLMRADAGRLWNDLAVARVLAGELPGAERACRHALRLLADVEGPGRTTLALYNLAEVRLRRGRVRGVAETLELSTAENRRAGNHRGLIRDLELWVRLELAHGRSVAALARCAEALRELDRFGLDERREVFEVLSARAHGWLGRRRQAAAALARATPEAVRELEPEERPAVWALAGRPEAAAEEAAGTPWAELWTALVEAAHPRSSAWESFRSLEPFRAARLVFDCELILPGVVPPSWVRRSVAALRRSGAEAMAEKLEARSLSPWRALEGYLREPPGNPETVAKLLATAGYTEARLSWVRRDRERILISGTGGPEELTASLDGGRLVLRTPVADGVLRTLFALIQRDLRPPADELERRPHRRRPGTVRAGGIVGESPPLRDALERLDRLAAGELPVLVLGESGTGKELAARRAHRLSRRSSGPFLAVNCAALSETLIQSDLFGHVKGSFTGADRDRAGVFESSRGGTVFLDEIGDLPLAAQGKLLRVLQEGEIRRVGESFGRKVDVRVVTATHRDLERMVREGTFRQDLYFRLKVATITLPPLRDRGKDILFLAEHFLSQDPLRRDGEPAPRLSRSGRERLLAHPWPGNVRELKNVLEVATALAEGGEIGAEHLDLPQPAREREGDYHQRLEGFRKNLVSEALVAAGGNRAEAARRLGLSRQALSYLVRQLGLS
jgi:two-component system NtrC family response regulator